MTNKYKTVNHLLKIATLHSVSVYRSTNTNYKAPSLSLDLSEYWNKKLNSFKNKRTKERQLYRYLHQNYTLFCASYEQLRININKNQECLSNSEGIYAKTNLITVYLIGAQICHLIKGKDKLDLLSSETGYHYKFMKRFIETRNKIFEHSYNPDGLNNIFIDINLDSVTHSNKVMIVKIHNHVDLKEEVQEFKLNRYDDITRLNHIILSVIKKF